MFDVKIDKKTKKILDKYWPGPVSIILSLRQSPCSDKKSGYFPLACLPVGRERGRFYHIHRGTNSISFRLGDKKWFRGFLKQTGPLAATSVNLEGQPFAETITEAKGYFGDSADAYWHRGKLDNIPSTIIKVDGGKVKVLRQGIIVKV